MTPAVFPNFCTDRKLTPDSWMNMTWRWLSESWKAASSVVKKGELFLPGTGAAQGIGMISLREKKGAIPFIHTRHFKNRASTAVSAVIFWSWITSIEIWDCLAQLLLFWSDIPAHHLSPGEDGRWLFIRQCHFNKSVSLFICDMLRYGQELLMMLLHQCCPWRQCAQKAMQPQILKPDLNSMFLLFLLHFFWL